ncbi:MAG: hypothetical protein AAFR82_11245 [Pseudomonadota bacterium]
MTHTTLQDDLAYVRDLAEAGQSAPLLGGRFLTFWGALTSVSYFLHYSISAGLFGWPEVAYVWVWGTFIVVGIVGQIVLGYSIRNKPGGNSVGNRTEATVWMAGGFALFAYFATLIVKSIVMGGPVSGFEESLPIVFAVYGTGLITSGVMSNTNTLTYAGYSTFLMIAIALWFEGTEMTWAIASLAAFATVLIPGLIMLRQEPKSVI